MSRKKWTKADENILRKNWNKPMEWLTKTLKRTPSQISGKAAYLQLPYRQVKAPNITFWTTAQEDILRKNLGKPMTWLMRKTGKTESAIKTKLSRDLKLKRSHDGWAKKWSEWDNKKIKILVNNADKPMDWLIKRLGISEPSIKTKMCRIGLKKEGSKQHHRKYSELEIEYFLKNMSTPPVLIAEKTGRSSPEINNLKYSFRLNKIPMYMAEYACVQEYKKRMKFK